MSHICIIEDDAAIAEIERDYLEINGFTVSIATDGVSGLNLTQKESFDLILLDLMLPPAAREAAPAVSASQRSQGYSPFGAASAESKFGPLKFGEGFDVERDSASKSGGLFSRKKHR